MTSAPDPRTGAHPPPRRGSGAGDGPPDGHDEDPPGDPESVARTVCLKLLESAARTRAELATKLATRGVPDDVAARVLDRFVEVGLIDDAAYARAWIDSRQRTRGLASRALAGELLRKGVARAAVTEALADVGADSEEAAARALVRRKLRSTAHLEEAARVRRLLGLLARKGYTADLARRVVRGELAGSGADTPGLVED